MRFRHVEPDTQNPQERPSRGLIVYDDDGTPRKWLLFLERPDGSISVQFLSSESHLLSRLDHPERDEERRLKRANRLMEIYANETEG